MLSNGVSASKARDHRDAGLRNGNECCPDLESGNRSKSVNAKLQKRVRKGIPDNIRGDAWIFLANRMSNANGDTMPDWMDKPRGPVGHSVVPADTLEQISRDVATQAVSNKSFES